MTERDQQNDVVDDLEHAAGDESLEFPAPVPELSWLYPARANTEWDALAAGIMKAAMPELERRRDERGLVRSILRFARPVSAQNQYSLLRREAEEELLPTCERLGIGVLPYFPLASGLLTGKYRRGEQRPEGTRLAAREEVFTSETFDRLEGLEEFAKERGVTLLRVAIGGMLAQPAIASVIAGATKPEQVRANVEAADWEPTSADVAALSSLR